MKKLRQVIRSILVELIDEDRAQTYNEAIRLARLDVTTELTLLRTDLEAQVKGYEKAINEWMETETAKQDEDRRENKISRDFSRQHAEQLDGYLKGFNTLLKKYMPAAKRK